MHPLSQIQPPSPELCEPIRYLRVVSPYHPLLQFHFRALYSHLDPLCKAHTSSSVGSESAEVVVAFVAYPCYQHRTIFHFIIKQRVILARRACSVSEIMGIVSWSSVIATDQLSSTSARSSSALTSSAPMKSCLHHPYALVRGPCF